MNLKNIIRLIILFIILIVVFRILFISTCNTYRGLVPIKEQRCTCLGLLFKGTRSPADDRPISDICIGIFTNRYFVDSY